MYLVNAVEYCPATAPNKKEDLLGAIVSMLTDMSARRKRLCSEPKRMLHRDRSRPEHNVYKSVRRNRLPVARGGSRSNDPDLAPQIRPHQLELNIIFILNDVLQGSQVPNSKAMAAKRFGLEDTSRRD